MTILSGASIDVFSPDKVADFIGRSDWSGCWSYLQSVLSSLSPLWSTGNNIGLQGELSDETRKKYVLSFGAMLGELIEAILSDPSSKISDKNFAAIMPHHETFHGLLYLFGRNDTDDIVERILNSSKELSENQQKKIAMLLSMSSKLDIVKILKKLDTKYRVMAVACYFSYFKIVDEKIYNNKIALFPLAYDLEKTFSEFHTLAITYIAYFQCSYLDTLDKHKIKKNINNATQRFLAQSQRDFRKTRSVPPVELPHITLDKSKPRLAVLMDYMLPGHAMIRVWGGWINALRSEFNVVIMAPIELCDRNLERDYPNIVVFRNIGEMVKLFHDYQPELLVMPSVGMGFYNVMAANMRLAPLQIMGLGHPATTMSPFIDFVYGPPQVYDERAFPEDKYVADSIPLKFTQNMSREKFEELVAARPSTKQDRVMNVSIVGAVQKMTAPFINLLKEIEDESDFDIIFTFHLGSLGFDSLYLQKFLQSKLKVVRFHGWQKYEDYIKSIALADIVLNPFPFGNTNTIIDTLLLGKPCIGLDGIEPAAKTEAYVLEVLGVKDIFVAKDTADYKQKFKEFSARIFAGDIDFIDTNAFFDVLYQKKEIGDVGKTLKWVFDHHKELRTAPQKYFSINDLMDSA